MSVKSVITSTHLIFYHLLLLPSSLSESSSFLMSQLFTSGGQSIKTSASVLPMNIQDDSFRIDWFHLLAVLGILKSLLQNHSSKASILQHSAFFVVQLSHPYMTAGKTIALTRWNFVCRVMSLLSNMLSRFIIALLPRSKHLFISWLQSPSTVILEPKKIKVFPLFTHLFALKWWDRMPWSSFSECWALSQPFHSPLSLSSRGDERI